MEDLEGMVEREETLGIRRIDEFGAKAFLDFFTCTECGRCTAECPANRTGKLLSPKHLTGDLRDFAYQHQSALIAAKRNGNGQASDGNGEDVPHLADLVDTVINSEVLWACTTCRACEQECPVFISYVDKIIDLRRYLVQEAGGFSRAVAKCFSRHGNDHDALQHRSGRADELGGWTGRAADERRARWGRGAVLGRLCGSL